MTAAESYMTSIPYYCILFALPALYRLLYSTGMRIGEAVSLKNGDIDFTRNYIIIRKTKNQQQRLVPLNSSMQQTLLQYKEMRDNMPLDNTTVSNNPFFISPSGRPLTKSSVYNWFRVILKRCGILHIGKQHGPRVHDTPYLCRSLLNESSQVWR